MLNEYQIDRVWKGMLEAETRSLYFAKLANRSATAKSALQISNLFLGSGSVATIVANSPKWVPIVLGLLAAFVTAYTVVVDMDRKTGVLVKLHSGWNRIASVYAGIWAKTYSDDAEMKMADAEKEENALSELAVTSAPNKPKELDECQLSVFERHGVSPI